MKDNRLLVVASVTLLSATVFFAVMGERHRQVSNKIDLRTFTTVREPESLDRDLSNFAHEQDRGDFVPVYCFNKTYLRKHIGRFETRRLFRDNPDARNLCGTLRCRGYRKALSRWMCHFDGLVFVDEVSPERPVPSVKAQTPRPFKRSHRP